MIDSVRDFCPGAPKRIRERGYLPGVDFPRNYFPGVFGNSEKFRCGSELHDELNMIFEF